jgi:uncharacterized repeat protein (TIGR01451 family)
MKFRRLYKRMLGTFAAAMLLAGATGTAMAAGTTSGTTISNQASVAYEVGGISQTPATSNNYQFVVDTKINLTVSTDDAAAIAVTPGTDDNVMTFTVLNSGNAAQDFSLSNVAVALGDPAKFGGLLDSINANTVDIFVETAGGAGYQAASDTDTHINALAPDASIKVYIVSDFDIGYSDGAIASYHLVAEARINDGAGTLGGALTETAGADTEGSVDIVFADGVGTDDASRDAKHSSQDDYEIAAAGLTVTKSSTIVWDPLNLFANPKRIPGAIVEYEIEIVNGAGASTATAITVTDILPAELGGVTDIEVTAPNLYGGATTALTNASGDDEGEYTVGTNTVTVTDVSLIAGETATVTFRVTIQ